VLPFVEIGKEPALEEKPEGRDTANFRALYRVGKIISAERDEVSLMNKVLKFLAGELPADNLYL